MPLTGFGNFHQTEALPGALPQRQNSPQKCAYDLYAEQLSGSAFTRTRDKNLHSWLYRRLPSVVHDDYQPYSSSFSLILSSIQAPNPYRWSPLPLPTRSCDFIDGLFPLAGTSHLQTFIYQFNQSMDDKYFVDNDGELLFIPYEGEIEINTEFGKLQITAGSIAVIPRGVKFKVTLTSPIACGYLCENAGAPLSLPHLGLIGANALANPRHFCYPCAEFEEKQTAVTIICKDSHRLWQCKANSTPLNVVAWQGNYAPYSYDLSLFNTINTVSFDHPDPSIFTVLSSESDTPGVANLDFVIFPERWMVSEHSFRPPYFHRNVMSELMGLIYGQYDAKQKGFQPGGVSIHNTMTAHGPDSESYQQAINDDLQPTRYHQTLAFMLETRDRWLIGEQAMKHSSRQVDYSLCWQGLK